MKVLWFYVFDFHPDSTRTQPIGAWITKDGSLDYAFDPAYPEDEGIPSDLINQLLEAGEKLISREALEYWQTHLGYYRSASEIQEKEMNDYAIFLAKISREIGCNPSLNHTMRGNNKGRTLSNLQELELSSSINSRCLSYTRSC